jgi:hypothetical protein
VPYVGYQATGLLGPEFNGIYNYTSLQATVRKQYSHGLTLQGSYTWSKDISDLNYSSTSGSAAAVYINNPQYPGQAYGPTNFNRPQRFIFNYAWDIPSHLNGLMGKVTRGWTWAGVTTIQDGTPMTFSDARTGSIWGLTGYGRAQMCPGASYNSILSSGGVGSRLGGVSGGPGFFNSGASLFCSAPAISDGTDFGNSGVGLLLGPGQFNFDISLIKNTRIGGIRENAVLQIRAEFFNAFNHAQFSNPGTTVSSPATFGVITSDTVNPRLIQFAMKYQF